MDFKQQDSAKKEQPLVSVYIPAYNGADFIAQTIQSVLDQTYRNFELVISDDCSTDNTVEIVNSFQDDRIHLIKNKNNLGFLGNFAQCVETTHGAYLKLLNDDDMLAPTVLERAVGILQTHPEVSVVTGSSVVIGSNNERLMERKLFQKDCIIDGISFARRTFHFGRNFYSEPGMMMIRNDKEFLRQFFPQIIAFGLDWELGLELSYTGKVCYLADAVGAFRVSADSTSLKFRSSDLLRMHMKIFDRHQEKGILHLTAFDRICFQVMVYANNMARYLIQRFVLSKRNKPHQV